MSLAVITDSSVNLPAEIQGHADVYILDIPVIIEEQPFVEGKNLDVNQFYEKMANSEELLKTSQPNLADLDNFLMELGEKGYTHVIGLFLSSGISGFWANSQFLIEDHAKLKVAFPDTKITAAPMGAMVRNVLHWSEQGMSFENILKKRTRRLIFLWMILITLLRVAACRMAQRFWGIFCLSNPFYILMLKAKSLFLKRYVQRRKL